MAHQDIVLEASPNPGPPAPEVSSNKMTYETLDVSGMSVLEDAPPNGSRLDRFLKKYRALHPDFDPSNLPLKNIILFGDSDFSKWKSIESEWNRVVNVGVGGAEMLQMAFYATECVDKYRPSILVLVGGENDLANDGVTPESTFGYFEKCYDRAVSTHKRSSDTLTIVYMGTKPEPATEGLHDRYLKYDEMIRNRFLGDSPSTTAMPNVWVNKKNKNTTFYYIDWWHLKERRFYANDGLHLSDLGYEIWRDTLQKIVEQKI